MNHVNEDEAREFVSLFKGNDQAYGQFEVTETTENGKVKGNARTIKGSPTLEIWLQHLNGRGPGLGIIPIKQDGCVHWCALDIDDRTICLKTLSSRIANDGLPLLVARSKSGGAHAYMFFKEPVKAELAQQVLKKLADNLGYGGCEIYPKQTELNEGEFGNFLNLPYFDHEQTQRPGFKDGVPLSLSGFIKTAKEMMVTQDQIDELLKIESDDDYGPQFVTGSAQHPPSISVPPVIPQGQRNTALVQLAASLRGRGLELETIRETLLGAARHQCNPPASEKEVENIVRWIERKDAGEVHIGLSDTGSGKLFCSVFGNELRYNYEAKSWYRWDGKVWRKGAQADAERAAKDIAHLVNAEADRMEAQGVSEVAKRMRKFAKRLHNRNGISNMLWSSQSENPVKTDDFDNDPWLLNMQNGILNLETGKLRPHDPDHLMTYISETAYDPEAECPRFITFMEEILGGDTELLRFIQKMMGYSLTGNIDEHCLFLLHGDGRNGKSTFVNILIKLLGTYHKRLEARSLIFRRNHNGMSNDIAAIAGKRLITTSEAPEDHYFNEALVKDLTGGDQISARYLYGEYFDFYPQAKIIMAVNHLPGILGADAGIWSRFRIVPFSKTIPEERRDKNLGRKLEEELPGIFNWVHEGLQLWQKEGLKTPGSVQKAVENYRETVDPVRSFLEEFTVEDPAGKVGARDLGRAYVLYARQQGESPLSQRSFGDYMRRLGYQKQRVTENGKKITAYSGLRLSGFESDYGETPF